jgi:hypothetical protein
MVPVSFAVMLLQHWGAFDYIAKTLEPVCKFTGLRGEAALVLITAFTMNLYSCIAVIETITFTGREICIMALMGLIAHNLIVETLVQVKTGSKGLRMIFLRIICAAIGGFFLNLALPPENIEAAVQINANRSAHYAAGENMFPSLPSLQVMREWLVRTLYLTLKLTCIVVALNILQRILDEFGVMTVLARKISPLMRAMGLPANTTFLWIVAYIVGLAYGAAILIEHRKENKITAREADLLNHHIAISHSLLEDTSLFLAIGAGLGWITLPRIVLAIIVVWVLRRVCHRSYELRTKIDSSLF